LGNAGSVLLDPKNLTIDAVNGIYPQYQLIDPRQGLGTATFGQSVLFLSTGNIVVTKPGDNFAGSTSGAAYLYNGLTAALISSLTGSVSGDQVGSSTPVALTGNGNYVIISPAAHNGALASAGGVTWGSGTTGVNGSISTSNSLMGGTASDQVGTVIALSNGNYGVAAPQWDNGATTNVGAVTLGNGTSGTVGTLTAAIALIGSTSGDNVGQTPFALTGNGNFVTRTTAWHSGALASVGAATWINGTTGLVGIVSSSNSLVGGSANDQLGSGGVLAISNGNYLVLSPLWDNTSPAAVDAGAVTWGSGTGGVTGLVSSSNSLVGTSASDGVGTVGNVNLLTGNGNYVVRTPNWDNTSPVTTNVGAVTWGNGATGISGVISSSNSLIGANSADQIGSGTPILLGNGNYVITSPAATVGGVSTAGAATWASGTSAITGVGVTSSNSLVGSISGSGIGSGIGKALTNNNYVVLSPNWRTSLAVTSLGAATLGNGTTGTTGIVSAANSIVGSTTSDAVGVNGATVLTNGNFVVSSPSWHNGALANAGAATWSSGTIGSQTVGVVSSANSLVGSSASDSVGNTIALTNGNYVAQTPNWDNGPTTDVGAATWGDGTVGVKGTISSANSLIGSTSGDNVGQSVTALTNGNYVTRTTNWDNGAVINVGAVTWGNGTTGITGVVSSANSLIGSTASDQIGSGGLTALTTGNYVVYSPNWDNGATVNAGAATFGSGTSGITGTITTQNSIVGGTANTSLTSIATGNQDVVNGTFLARFANEGTTGRIRVGMVSPDQLTFARAQAQTVTVTPSFITQTLNAGTALSLQANNDLTINSALTVNNPSGSGGNLTLSAGRSALINANITTDDGSLTIIGNEILSAGVVDSARDAGNATISIASGVTINTGAGNLILNLKDGAGKTNSGSGDLTLGANSTLQASGAGTVSLTAAVNNITLGTNSIVQSMNGNLQLNAGVAITAAGAATVRTTGSGTLILVVDTLFPTSPGIGTGNISAPSATFSTGGGFLRLFTAKQSLNSLPSTINGASYTPGTEFVNSSTEEWGIYYPNGDDGVPFKVFYKNTATPTPPTPSGGGGAVTPPQLLGSRLSKTLSHFYMASSEAFADWELLDQFYVYDYFICEGGTSCPLFNAYEQLQHERSLRGDCVCTFEYFRGRRFYPPVVIRR
jgi:hypothetical protein